MSKSTKDMENHNTKNKSGIILDILKFILPTGAVFIIGAFLLNNYFIKPKISYSQDEVRDNFYIQSDFRGVSMRIYPQMIICYDNYIILVTHLDGYYEDEFINFEDGVASAIRTKQDYCDMLLKYIRDSLLEELNVSYGDEEIKEISKKLNIYISLLGGVQYENRLGNIIKKYCIIEANGLVVDYGYNEDEIKNRLYENELVLGDNPNVITANDEVNKIVKTVSEEIGILYDRRSYN